MAEPTTEEGTLRLSDGEELYTKTWVPTEPAKARLVFLHGFSDHCNFYYDFFPALARRGIKVYSFDQRGWGRSAKQPAQKGRTGSTSQVMDDITQFLHHLPAAENHLPLFLMGHSMGGAETLYYAATGPKETTATIRGFLCNAPYIALVPSAEPSKITVVLGRLISKVIPNTQMVNKLDKDNVCRDPAVCEAWAKDPLNHDTGTLLGLAGMLDRSAALDSGQTVVKEGVGEGDKTRLWIGHGTDDKVCAFAATKKLFDRTKVQDKSFQVYEGWYHKLHTEPGEDAARHADDVVTWILNRSGPLDSLDQKAKL